MARTKKTTTTSNGGRARRTRTLSSTGGVTESYSYKPNKLTPRKTVSVNQKTGKMRTTYSQKLGGGWTDTRTTTTTINKKIAVPRPRTAKPKFAKMRTSSGTGVPFPVLVLGFIMLCIVGIWPVTMPYVATIACIIAAIVFIFMYIHYILLGVVLFGMVYLLDILNII